MIELLAQIDAAGSVEADADDAAALAGGADRHRQRPEAAGALDRHIDAAHTFADHALADHAFLDRTCHIAIAARIMDLAGAGGLGPPAAVLQSWCHPDSPPHTR